ncbi:Transposase, IS30 family [Piscirickettsia salmonis]|nr:Transposase, IS30 family [Piscirickettsia salmonis]
MQNTYRGSDAYDKQAKTVINTFMNVVGSTFFDFKTITSDNGTEFAGHEAISKITEADFYFARPYRSLRAMECKARGE